MGSKTQKPPTSDLLISGFWDRFIEPPSGLEPPTYALRMRCSTS